MSEEDDESSMAIGQAIGASLFVPILSELRKAELAK